ncbi:MAG TPA: sulfotransferase [Streptosporangiaceae bacterium]|jgi:hypothetical protein
MEGQALLRGNAPAPPANQDAGGFADPVFVLCNGRSGSTLLRFLLDAHPELACPPETNLPGLCVQLATVWSLIEGAPLSANRGDEPPKIPEAAIAGVRETMDRMVGSYLARRGKNRYCDKSLGTARFAELLLRVYPEAKFICVYRHPMDVIASGMEACPWGLNGYGFEPYIAATPGNAVMALAHFWMDNVRAALAAEERFPDRCYRLRYEDLVADAEGTASDLFAFLNVAPVPGISQTCFSSERERFGPADYKIWSTSRITSDSVGRGWSVPAGMIAPQILTEINELTGKLGYLPVDGDWGTTEPPADLRVQDTETSADPGEAAAPAEDAATVETAVEVAGPRHSQWLGDQLRAGVTSAGATLAERWEEHQGETLVAVALAADPAQQAEYWLVDLKAGTVTFTSRQAQENSDWDVVGSAEVWRQVIERNLNYYVALRSCRLRYCDNDEASTPLIADSRIVILAKLLGLTRW